MGSVTTLENKMDNLGLGRNAVHVKNCLCSLDIVLLSFSLCPYYLPREFTCIIVMTTSAASKLVYNFAATRVQN